MEKKSSASSRPAKRRRVKNEDIFNEQGRAQLLALENQAIDTTDPDAPEVT